jgi:hypothetical protein
MREKWGYVDKSGKLVIDYQYKHAMDFSVGARTVTRQRRVRYPYDTDAPPGTRRYRVAVLTRSRQICLRSRAFRTLLW